MNQAIEMLNVSYSYKVYDDASTVDVMTQAVSNVDLTVRQGEFLALVGRNGSGKSTLAKMMNALFEPSGGQVNVYGMNTTDKSKLFEIRKNVGMVFQNPDNQMVASIVEEDVAFGPENLGLPQQEIARRVEWALQQVGMSEYAKRSPHKLSGGQKQRIAIAGALAILPQTIVFDESTAMLDPIGRKEVLSVIKKLNSEMNMTVILITHFMDEVATADRVAVMSKGRLLATGSPREIFANTQVLDQAGLLAPSCVRLGNNLIANGIEVQTDANADKFADNLCIALGLNEK